MQKSHTPARVGLRPRRLTRAQIMDQRRRDYTIINTVCARNLSSYVQLLIYVIRIPRGADRVN